MLAHLHWTTALWVDFATANKRGKVFQALVGLVEDSANEVLGGVCRSGPSCLWAQRLCLPSLFLSRIHSFSLKLLKKVLLGLTWEILDFSLCFLCLGIFIFIFHFWRAERHKAVTFPVAERFHPPAEHPVPFPVVTGSQSSCHCPAHRPSLLMFSRDLANASEQQVTVMPWYFKSFKRRLMGK